MRVRQSFVCIGLLFALTSLFIGCGRSDVDTELVKQTKKAESGDAEAQLTLGSMCYTGDGVPKDMAKAAEWYQKAAQQGNAEAQFALGRMYFRGEGVPKDTDKAVLWFRKAAEQGDAKAINGLGVMYRYGEGVPKDLAKAAEFFQQAAEQGNAMAQANIGEMYSYGEGVPRDMAKAAEWYQKAAQQGDDRAQRLLGQAYMSGKGVTKDLAKALEWYQKAAQQGDAEAQFTLGSMYYTGDGVPKDLAKAVEWCQKAAQQGRAWGQRCLGGAYEYGEGVYPPDRVLAYAWYNLAAAGGNKDAKAQRDKIILTPELLAEAQQLSSNWKQGQILVRESGRAAAERDSASRGALAKKGAGTAFLVTMSGQAVTSYHVIDGCKEVRAEGREGTVKVVTTDAVNDIALVQVPGHINARATICSDPAKLRQGEDIAVFGFPLNTLLSSGGNLTPGVVSALTGLGNNTNQIQITAPIQPGSSGSPVLNKKGHVVGVVSMKLSDRGMAKATGTIGQNVNFGVSGQTLKTFLETHKVDYRTSWPISFNRDTVYLADEARKWTLVLECWQ